MVIIHLVGVLCIYVYAVDNPDEEENEDDDIHDDVDDDDIYSLEMEFGRC